MEIPWEVSPGFYTTLDFCWETGEQRTEAWDLEEIGLPVKHAYLCMNEGVE